MRKMRVLLFAPPPSPLQVQDGKTLPLFLDPPSFFCAQTVQAVSSTFLNDAIDFRSAYHPYVTVLIPSLIRGWGTLALPRARLCLWSDTQWQFLLLSLASVRASEFSEDLWNTRKEYALNLPMMEQPINIHVGNPGTAIFNLFDRLKISVNVFHVLPEETPLIMTSSPAAPWRHFRMSWIDVMTSVLTLPRNSPWRRHDVAIMTRPTESVMRLRCWDV